MKSKHYVFPGRELIVVDAQGTADLAATKAMIRGITELPQYDSMYEILLDLRELECRISTLEIFELASWMAYPHPALPTRRKIAIVKSDTLGFDDAAFLAMCASNRGLHMRAFRSMEEADLWLDAPVPDEDLAGEK